MDEATLPLSLLRGWSELWRYPDLVAAVAAGTSIEPVEASVIVARGIARCLTPEEALRSHLEAGNYQAARFMLESAAFRSVAGHALETLQAEVSQARERARFNAVSKRFEIDAKAARLGLIPDVTEAALLRTLESNPAEAALLLEEWSRTVEERECELRAELERCLRDQEIEAAASKHGEVWTDLIRSCIASSRFELAKRILDLHPESPLPRDIDPVAVPRPRRWHYDTPTDLVVRQMRGLSRADVGFAKTWGPVIGDGIGEQLLDWLAAHAGEVFSGNESDVGEFAALLDGFVSATPSNPCSAQEIEGGYLTHSHALIDHRVPRLAACKDGVPLFLPREAGIPVPARLFTSPVVLAFHAECTPLGRVGLLGFSARHLFELMPDRRNRKVNFLRTLLAHFPPEAAVPGEFDTGNVDPAAAESWSYAAWFFDFLGIKVDAPSTLDVIKFYGSRRTDVLIPLLAAIVATPGARSAPVTANDAHRAWTDASFQASMVRRILGGLDADGPARAVLGSIVGITRLGEDIALADLEELLATDFAARHLGSETVSKACDRLIHARLLEQGTSRDYVRLPSTGVSYLVSTAIGDPEVFVLEALRGTP